MCGHLAGKLTAVSAILWLSVGTFAQPGCRQAIAQKNLCRPAASLAITMMQDRHLVATTVVQDVSTGALIVFASSRPTDLDVATPILPLSLSKLYLAASWLDHKLPDQKLESHDSTGTKNPTHQRISVREMLVGGSDSAGRQMAIALRNSVGTQAVLADLKRYGFDGQDDGFWAYVTPAWKARLTPPPASISLQDSNDAEWADALSIGESHMTTDLLRVSRFLQAVGNNGVECVPVAMESVAEREETKCIARGRIVEKGTAKEMMAAMLDTVKRGSAVRIADSLKGTGWAIGGKTGTGGVPGAPLERQDGCFAGLIFDGRGKARFTVATFVRSGGIGGGSAAEISAALARLLAAGSSGR
jgi:cell division protein FtsI/penicillin-binding protein 2